MPNDVIVEMYNDVKSINIILLFKRQSFYIDLVCLLYFYVIPIILTSSYVFSSCMV